MTAILPGSVIGVLGSGQLGRMFAIAARQMGYRVHTYSPDSDTPAGQVSDVEIRASYEDLDAVRRFAKSVQVVTFEFENIPTATVETASEWTMVRPAGRVLHTSQHRIREKSFLTQLGLPTARFAEVQTLDDLRDALQKIGLPAIVKTASFGYDGKGQYRVEAVEDAEKIWPVIDGHRAIVEEVIDFEREISVVAARDVHGNFVHYGAIENTHVNHILDVSVAPAPVSPEVEKQAIKLARAVLENLGVVGVLCVEMFVTRDQKILINELAPRPHNSGHLTIDACVTSQFEQQLRAVCGLPLGSTEFLRAAAMANLLGEVWALGEPDWEEACKLPGVRLHLYGKQEARKGRKMGHLTALAGNVDEARHMVLAARARLARVG